MKRCPECRRDYHDESLSFCLVDGAALVTGLPDEPPTAIMSGDPGSGERQGRELSDEGRPQSALSKLRGRERLAWVLTAILLLGFLASLPFVVAYLRRSPPDAPALTRYEIIAPEKTTLNLIRWPAIAVSPDGSTIVFSATTEGVNRLFLRRRDDTTVRLIPGTEGASYPEFSPDGRWIAFAADFTLKKVPLEGPVTMLAKVGDIRGLTWAGNDNLIYSPSPAEPLFRIPANGGDPQPVSALDAGKNERTHRWPQVLPGGKAVIFTVGTLDSPDSYENSTIEAVILATGERRVLLQGASTARYIPTGHLVFARGGNLFAVGFDAETLIARGTPVSVLQGVAGDETTGAIHFSVADDGTLAYVRGGTVANLRRVLWVDRGGNVQPVNVPAAQYNDLRISPDGSRLACIIGSSGSGDIWVYDFARATSTRLTFNARNASPAWSADGQTIYYSEIDPTAKTTLMRKPADGSRDAEAVISFGNTTYIKALRTGGTSAIFDEQMNTNRGNILMSDLAPGAQPSFVVNTTFNEYAAALSPDGRFLAYQSNENGRHEIYVRDISGAGGRWQVSTEGGEEPHWSHDGRELYFRNNDLFMGAAVDASQSFKAGTPQKLFGGTFNLRSNSGVSYDVDPKSGRFLMIRPAEDYAAVAQVQVALNWFGELRRMAPPQ